MPRFNHLKGVFGLLPTPYTEDYEIHTADLRRAAGGGPAPVGDRPGRRAAAAGVRPFLPAADAQPAHAWAAAGVPRVPAGRRR